MLNPCESCVCRGMHCEHCMYYHPDWRNEFTEEELNRPVIVDKDQKLLETLHLFNDSVEGMLFYYINHHPEEFPASRISTLIKMLNNDFLSERIHQLEHACDVSKERAIYLRKYLDGTLYKTEEAAMLAREAQIANAEAIVKVCEGEEL